MPGRLISKVAVITGAASGIGRATAIAYAYEGATIVVSDIREDARPDNYEKLSGTTVEEVQKLGQKALFIKCDTSDASQVENLVKTAVSEFGRVDIFVNNAGVAFESGTPTSIDDYPEDWFDRTIAVNLRGVFLGTKYASRQMKLQEPHASGDRGWIINVASVNGLRGASGSLGYVTSKHGVIGLTKTAALDLGASRIHVNALCPGYTETSMTKVFLSQPERRSSFEPRHPFRGLGTADDLAKAAVFLASEDAAWVSGIALPVDGGFMSG